MQFARAVVLGGIILGCASNAPTPFPRITTSSAGTADAIPPPVDAHAWQGVLMRDAVVRGDLPAAKMAAANLIAIATSHETPVPGSKLEAMVEATHRVADAQDLHAAAHAFAYLSERCGECHAFIGGPLSGPSLPPPLELGIVPRMNRHQWGASRLWEGLVAPSNEAWTSGAIVLTDAPLGANEVPGHAGDAEIAALSSKVHDLGIDATKATKGSRRIAIYGQLLDTCAACHQRLHAGPR
jgi:hypothetical protein